MPRTGQPSVRHVAAVQRALAVVDALGEGAPELGTNEIARRTGINASTVSRLLATLAAAGIVEHVEATGRYRLGLRLLQLGNVVLARLDLREIVRPHLRTLVNETGETATLSVPGEQDAVTVDFVQSASSVRSATGKVMLAFGGAGLPRGALTAYTERTITDRRALAGELEQVRRQGFAEAVGEREAHLNAIAAPVLGGRGELAAILGVQGPGSRFGEDAMRRALTSLLAHAATVSRELGWDDAGERPD